MRLPHIRAYRISDRRAVRNICIETGVAGRTIRDFLDPADTWADLWTEYYLTREPAHCWVATDPADQPVGYLLGASDSRAADAYFAARVLPQVALRELLLFRWLSGRRRAFFDRMIESARKGLLSVPREVVDAYPCHFHFNLLDGYRGQGIGSRLYDLFESGMHALGRAGIHSQVMCGNDATVQFHRKRGFTEVSRMHVPPLDDCFPPGRFELAVLVKPL